MLEYAKEVHELALREICPDPFKWHLARAYLDLANQRDNATWGCQNCVKILSAGHDQAAELADLRKVAEAAEKYLKTKTANDAMNKQLRLEAALTTWRTRTEKT